MLRFKLTVGEDMDPVQMIQSELVMPLQISIGQIEMPISSLIKLDSLSAIDIDLSDRCVVTLLLGGDPIATADVAVVGDRISLKINKIFLEQFQESSDNNEVALENFREA